MMDKIFYPGQDYLSRPHNQLITVNKGNPKANFAQ